MATTHIKIIHSFLNYYDPSDVHEISWEFASEWISNIKQYNQQTEIDIEQMIRENKQFYSQCVDNPEFFNQLTKDIEKKTHQSNQNRDNDTNPFDPKAPKTTENKGNAWDIISCGQTRGGNYVEVGYSFTNILDETITDLPIMVYITDKNGNILEFETGHIYGSVLPGRTVYDDRLIEYHPSFTSCGIKLNR